MITSPYELGTVLCINYKGIEVLARVAGYIDSLDATKPILVNLRVSDGLRWGSRMVKVKPEQVRGEDKEWYQRQHEQWEASIRQTAEASLAKMKPAEKLRLRAEAEKRRRRSPLDIAIDRACGIE